MPTYKIWHGECGSYDEAKEVTADSPEDAAKRLLFVYSGGECDAGDCDWGADAVSESPDGRFMATRQGSSDYFLIEQHPRITDVNTP